MTRNDDIDKDNLILGNLIYDIILFCIKGLAFIKFLFYLLFNCITIMTNRLVLSCDILFVNRINQ